MPLEAVLLFRPDALRPHLAAFHLPEEAHEWRQALQREADLFLTPQGFECNKPPGSSVPPTYLITQLSLWR